MEKRKQKEIEKKTTDKPKQGNEVHRVTPLSIRERYLTPPKPVGIEWFNARRQARPMIKPMKAAGGVLLPKHLMEGANKLVHESFVPPEAELHLSPRIVGRKPHRLLRRFSGEKVIPMNSTWLDGNDDRQIYYDDSYPWCCIGRVAWNNKWGSGTIVGKNIVLTASHVVAGAWTPDKPLKESITFTPAQFGSKSILGADWTTNVIGIAAWQEIDDVVGYDMALLLLDKPLGDWLGYFGSRGYDDDWEDNPWWEHEGYPYDMSMYGVEPCYQLNITINDDDSDDFNCVELETDADIASGQSGGPLWAHFAHGGNQIIGVLSGHQDSWWETTNIFAGGSGLNALVKWGRKNWG